MHGRKKVARTDEYKAKVKVKIQKYVAITEGVLASKKAKEYTPEKLEICGKILAINPQYYTIWNYRREILLDWFQKEVDDTDFMDKKKKWCQTELYLTERSLLNNPKSYCSWFHRRWTVEQGTSDLDKELALCTRFLKRDSRNFHCWNYRRFIVKKAGVPLVEEFDYTSKLIESNFSNYSAWHYRSTLLPELVRSNSEFRERLDTEIEYAMNAFYTEPDDQSAWLYHRWLLARRGVGIRVASGNTDKNLQSKFGPIVRADGDEEDEKGTDSLQSKITFIQSQLSSFQELLEIEPDCKWALLISAILIRGLLMCGVKRPTAREEVCEIFQKLIQLDEMRSGYYRDVEQSILSQCS